ncbi:MAG: enoyl-ACP reductase [Magnetococcales bacterium]|nr:enoyl-ACP reductase [Magnetococcales bacterium]
MGILDGKRGLIFGVANERSIAWGIAQACHREGAVQGFTYLGSALEKRVRPLAESLGSTMVLPCNVTVDEEMAAVFAQAREEWGGVDYVLHSVAFARKEELKGHFYQTTPEGFRIAMETSVYSLVSMCRHAAPLMSAGGSILTLSYLGAERVMPHYNVMGVAKAALEASVRYLAVDMGPRQIRVNAISAGPIKTLAASGIGDFKEILNWNRDNAPMRRNVETAEVAEAAVFLLSAMGGGVTGEVLHVDAGYHVVGMRAENIADEKE